MADLDAGTTVVLPSATFPVAELRKITAIQHYEERMLFTALLLRQPRARVLYATSLPVDGDIVEYYLRFLPDPESARDRLELISLEEPGPEPLTEKLLGRPQVVSQVRELAGGADEAYILPFNVTPLERRLADELGLPVYGPDPELARLGSKSGSRHVARRAGVPVAAGAEELYSEAGLEQAILALRAERPNAHTAVIKLNDGFSGQGNALVELADVPLPLSGAPVRFCAAEESWPSFLAKVEAGGAVVEELLGPEGMASPSAQMRISPTGALETLSTHDQILGGPDNHVYLGCRFPAQGRYRLAIQEAATRVGRVLAGEGVMGSFGVDFLVSPDRGDGDVYLSEINLRMGGTTHPFWMARLATEGTYDAGTGELVADGRSKHYVATDNLRSDRLVGRGPGQVIDAIDRAGLGYEHRSRTGATLHLLGAVPRFGKMGVTCIGDSPEEAESLYRSVVEVLEAVGR